MLFNEVADIMHFDLVNSRTYPMKFKDCHAPALFSSTFKALNLGEKNSSTFKDAWEPWKEEETTGQKYNGLPYSIGQP